MHGSLLIPWARQGRAKCHVGTAVSLRWELGEKAGGGPWKGEAHGLATSWTAMALMFPLLRAAIVPGRPESGLNGASVPSCTGRPGLVASHPGSWETRAETSCPHCECLEGQLEEGLKTSTHLCPPEKSCPAGGGGGRRERRLGMHLALCLGACSIAA